MQVVLNARPLLSPLTGVGQYVCQLALALQTMGDLQLHFFTGFSWNSQIPTSAAVANTKINTFARNQIPGSYTVAKWMQQRAFSKGARSRKIDLYHETNFLAQKFDGPSVVTVHDLSWIRYPETHPAQRVQAFNRYFQVGVERASAIITDSQFVKNELIEVFKINPAQIHPIALGVEPLFHPRTASESVSVLSRYALVHGQYFLTVGTLEPRKNLRVAIDAFSRLPDTVRARYPLVLVGTKGWLTDEIENRIRPLLNKGEVRQLGYVSREELATLTAGACALVYPSLYEGFGLPPLEAMASGVPVISSTAAALMEVVGDTGMLIDSGNVDGFTEAMRTMIADNDLHDELSRKALARSALFSWAECAGKTAQLYRNTIL